MKARYAVYTYKYFEDEFGNESYPHAIKIHKIWHTIDATYCNLDELYDEILSKAKMKYLKDDVKGLLRSSGYLSSLIDAGEIDIDMGYVEYGFLDKYIVKIKVQILNEGTQIN